MRYDRFAERHSFDLLGFIQLLYDTTCLKVHLWVKLVWGLGWLVGAFNQEKALVGAFSVIVQLVMEPMEHYTALVTAAAINNIPEHIFPLSGGCCWRPGPSYPGTRSQPRLFLVWLSS